MAALQTGDEVSKMITQDPNQSLGTAAINIGLSGILGGVGGSVIGSVSPLFNKAANVVGVNKLANDFMGETKFLQATQDGFGDVGSGAASEVSGRMAETEELLNKVGDLKGKAIAATLPEQTPENVAKIDAHLQDLADQGAKKIDEAANNAYLKSAVPKLTQDLTDFNDVITNPQSSIQDKWDALNTYKKATQAHATYNQLVGGAEDKALSSWIKPFGYDLRQAAENTSVWGEAGNVQKNVNKALADLFPAQKDFVKRVTTPELGERIADPDKLQSLINQVGKGKAALKANAVNNYLDTTQKTVDALNGVYVNAGLEKPLESLNPTPILNRVLNTPPSAGRSLAQWANQNGARLIGNATGEGAAGLVGGGLGALVGHPIVGAYAGEKF